MSCRWLVLPLCLGLRCLSLSMRCWNRNENSRLRWSIRWALRVMGMRNSRVGWSMSSQNHNLPNIEAKTTSPCQTKSNPNNSPVTRLNLNFNNLEKHQISSLYHSFIQINLPLILYWFHVFSIFLILSINLIICWLCLMFVIKASFDQLLRLLRSRRCTFGVVLEGSRISFWSALNSCVFDQLFLLALYLNSSKFVLAPFSHQERSFQRARSFLRLECFHFDGIIGTSMIRLIACWLLNEF